MTQLTAGSWVEVNGRHLTQKKCYPCPSCEQVAEIANHHPPAAHERAFLISVEDCLIASGHVHFPAEHVSEVNVTLKHSILSGYDAGEETWSDDHGLNAVAARVKRSSFFGHQVCPSCKIHDCSLSRMIVTSLFLVIFRPLPLKRLEMFLFVEVATGMARLREIDDEFEVEA